MGWIFPDGCGTGTQTLHKIVVKRLAMDAHALSYVLPHAVRWGGSSPMVADCFLTPARPASSTRNFKFEFARHGKAGSFPATQPSESGAPGWALGLLVGLIWPARRPRVARRAVKMQTQTLDITDYNGDAIVLFVYAAGEELDLRKFGRAVDKMFDGAVTASVAKNSFRGDAGSKLTVERPQARPREPRRVVLVGLGDDADWKVTGRLTGESLKGTDAANIGIVCIDRIDIQPLMEGLLQGLYTGVAKDARSACTIDVFGAFPPGTIAKMEAAKKSFEAL